MVKLSGVFNQFRPFRALVLGDFLLDTYTTGRVRRISPEAPVIVLEVSSEESRPGGAGNVVLNLGALGGEVIALGRIGADLQGETLKSHFSQRGVNVSALLTEPGYQTPLKNRLISDSQQLLRVDHEKVTPLLPFLEEAMIERLESLMKDVEVVAISDYGKGFLTDRLIASAIEIARKYQIPTIVDPKGTHFKKYKGAFLLKPNLSEAYAAAKLPMQASLEEVAEELLSTTGVERLLITRSEAGMTLFNQRRERIDFPVRSREVKDVTGAGDTVLAVLCLSLASGLEIECAVQLANLGAGIAIERIGCAQITISELAERLLVFDRDTKIFDESHTYALQQVLRGKRYALLVLEKGQQMTSLLFQMIRKLGNREGVELMIYVPDLDPNDELIHLLSSLREVNYIILQTESLKHLCETIHPDEVYILPEERQADPKELLSSLISAQRTFYHKLPEESAFGRD